MVTHVVLMKLTDQGIKDINLKVNEGETIVIIGPSGTGKSTLLRCINHLEKIDTGRVLVDGQLIGYRQKGSKLYELEMRQRAEKAMEALKKLSAPRASVCRDGRQQEIPTADLVPGDIVAVGLGDIVPADIRITETGGITINEGVLTGESLTPGVRPGPTSTRGTCIVAW